MFTATSDGIEQCAMADLVGHDRKHGERKHRHPLCRYPVRPRLAEVHGRLRPCLPMPASRRRTGTGARTPHHPCQHIIETTLPGPGAAALRPEPSSSARPDTRVALADGLAVSVGGGVRRRLVLHRP